MLERRRGTISPAGQVDFVELAFGDVTYNRDLPPDSPDARICTYECTFCASCVDGICPNCGGNFERRPIRPAARLARDPASTVRLFAPEGCA